MYAAESASASSCSDDGHVLLFDCCRVPSGVESERTNRLRPGIQSPRWITLELESNDNIDNVKDKIQHVTVPKIDCPAGRYTLLMATTRLSLGDDGWQASMHAPDSEIHRAALHANDV